MNYFLLAIVVLLGATSGYLWFRLRSVTRLPDRVEVRPRLGAEAARSVGLVSPALLAVDILETMAEGVLVLDGRGRPEYANPAAAYLLGFEADRLPSRLPAAEVADLATTALEGGSSVVRVVEVWYPQRSTLRVKASPLKNEPGVLLVIQDVSEEVDTQRLRREFVAHASHELKSPVASLHALAEAVSQAIVDDDEAATRFVARLLSETDRLAKLVMDLLDLSRLEDISAGPTETTDLAQIARDEAAHIERVADEDDPEVDRNIPERLEIVGDAQQLGLMIRNLLENALQHTPGSGRVDLEVGTSGTEAFVRVRDTGTGIPQEAQARVFERFYRVDQARARAHGGTGLGLAIVKHVVELHGGRIELESTVGEGSTFTVHLPDSYSEPGSYGANISTQNLEESS